METFSALLALCAGISPVPGEFPAQRPVTRSFDVFFDLHRINGWVNTREAGDFRRYRAHYDVIVMCKRGLCCTFLDSFFDDVPHGWLATTRLETSTIGEEVHMANGVSDAKSCKIHFDMKTKYED